MGKPLAALDYGLFEQKSFKKVSLLKAAFANKGPLKVQVCKMTVGKGHFLEGSVFKVCADKRAEAEGAAHKLGVRKVAVLKVAVLKDAVGNLGPCKVKPLKGQVFETLSLGIVEPLDKVLRVTCIVRVLRIAGKGIRVCHAGCHTAPLASEVRARLAP